jgi:uncharacterized protein
MDQYIPRSITSELTALLAEYPVVTVLGPRQAGKTTLARHMLTDYCYVNLELPENRQIAETDPKTFLSSLGEKVILDEIQRVPSLLSYIQVVVDEQQRTGHFVLTGSHQLELNASITQSLAGRTAILKLFPLSMEELLSAQILDKDFDQIALTGFLPRVISQGQRPLRAYANYFQTYVERDVRQLINVKDVSLFEKFLRLLAGRIGQPLNLSSLGNDVGIDQKTVKHWLSILEASYIIFRLPPYFENFGKRLIKSPKYYFVEVGLLVYLLGIEEPEQLKRDPLVGSIFENLVIIEIVKALLNRGKEGNVYFFRDHAGEEVDLLLPKGRSAIPIEIKSAATFSNSFLKGISRYRSVASSDTEAFIIYSGDSKPLGSSLRLLNFRECSKLVERS